MSTRTASPRAPAGVIRVASLPAEHVYVRHIADPGGSDGVVRLPEPFRGGPAGASWYPSPMLDPRWIARNAHAFDVMHVHFGFDHLPAERLQAAVDAVHAAGRPLVFTVHDLRNPHHLDPAAHDRALDVLVAAADALITLTPGAAAEIARRWGREARVAPHPHVVPEALVGRRPRRGGPFTVGIHLKNVRANMVALPAVEAVLAGVAAVGGGARLRIDIHERPDTPGDPLHAPELMVRLRELARDPAVDLHVHPFFDDDALWAYLASLDVSVLPYRFGTHSGWLEACHDLGTAVVAPDCGHYAEQHDVVGFRSTTDADVRRTLPGAIARAHARGAPVPADPAERHAERVALAALHRRVYAGVIAAAASAPARRAASISPGVGSRSTRTSSPSHAISPSRANPSSQPPIGHQP
ncbi:glycosyltransferase family 1 protein [Miltoncostaea oceani]|uniref:glycosyltransferase family 1 protein n=1 Tax=Miltoncostaea oceani TaxID=2843216 RepID=UPI0031B9F66C